MTEELYQKVEMLLSKLNDYRKTQTLSFKNIDEKMVLQEVYKKVYPFIQLNMSCASCVLMYLNHLESWYEREHPKYLAQMAKDAPESPESTIQYDGIKQGEVPVEPIADEPAPVVEEQKKVRKSRTKKSK